MEVDSRISIAPVHLYEAFEQLVCLVELVLEEHFRELSIASGVERLWLRLLHKGQQARCLLESFCQILLDIQQHGAWCGGNQFRLEDFFHVFESVLLRIIRSNAGARSIPYHTHRLHVCIVH